MAWRLAGSLVGLRAELNTNYPRRSKVSDGTIGDEAHRDQGSDSDHNPWLPGEVVSALDITTRTDADPGDEVFERIRLDPRTKYVIRKKRIGTPWSNWSPYYGDDHDTHTHISVSTDPDLYDDASRWLPDPPAPQSDTTHPAHAEDDDMASYLPLYMVQLMGHARAEDVGEYAMYLVNDNTATYTYLTAAQVNRFTGMGIPTLWNQGPDIVGGYDYRGPGDYEAVVVQ